MHVHVVILLFRTTTVSEGSSLSFFVQEGCGVSWER